LTKRIARYRARPFKGTAMKTNVRRSSLKHRRRTGFRRRMRTRGGRALLSRQRALASGKKKKVQGHARRR
jgi:large subunit ribosomal protein L34